MGRYEQQELIAKTTYQLNKEAGWIAKVIKDPVLRAKMIDEYRIKIKQITEGPKEIYTDYKKLEARTSKMIQEANKWKYDEFKKYVKNNPKDINARRILTKWDKDTKEQGLKYHSRSKIEERFTEKPILTTGTYAVGAKFAPFVTLFASTAHPLVEKGLGGVKTGLEKFDPYGIPIGGHLADFIPGTPEGLIGTTLFFKGAGKVIKGAPKFVHKGISRGYAGKGIYTLATAEDREDYASGIVDVGFGFGSMLVGYGYRRGRLSWDKKMVIKYSPIERAKYESLKLKGKKYSMKSRPTKEQDAIKKALKEARILWKEHPEVRELSFAGMERITPEAEEELLKFLTKRRRKLVVGGTAGTRSQTIAPDLYSPHDVDLFTTRGKPTKHAKKLLKQFEKAGIFDYKLKGAELIYKPTGKGAIEFHTFEEFLGPNIEQIAPFWRTAKAGVTKTPKKIKVLALRSQLGQKTLGFYRYGTPRYKDLLYAERIATPSLEAAKRKRLATEKDVFLGLFDTPIQGLDKKVIIKKKVIPPKKQPGKMYEFIDEGVNFDYLAPDYKKYPSKKYKQPIYKKYKPFKYDWFPSVYKPIKKPYKPTKYKRYPKKTTYRPATYDWFPSAYAPYKPVKKPLYKPYKPIKPVKKPPYRPVKTPYQPITPFDLIEPIIFRPKKKVKKRVGKKKKIKKGRRYTLRPTAGQIAGVVRRRGRRKELWQLTGFEVAR